MELFQSAEFWVGVALLIFFGMLIWLKVPSAAAKGLDGYAAKIQAELDEAQSLRIEAECLLSEIRAQRAESEKLAADMLAQATADAERIRVDAKAKLDEQIKRRGELAERRIANAEAQATAEVKAAAADLAAQAAEVVLTKRLAGAKTDPLVDGAIAQLAIKLQ